MQMDQVIYIERILLFYLGFGTGISQQISTLLTAGVKALLPASKELYVTRIVDTLMDLKQDPSMFIFSS